jgi:hypothetical protein
VLTVVMSVGPENLRSSGHSPEYTRAV